MVVGIATNLEAMAADMRREWADGPDAFAATIAAAGPDGDRYRAPEEATLDLFKSLYTAVELVADHKLARPLGESADKERPKLAESWRSGRSLDNIRLKLEAAGAMRSAEPPPGLQD